MRGGGGKARRREESEAGTAAMSAWQRAAGGVPPGRMGRAGVGLGRGLAGWLGRPSSAERVLKKTVSR